MFVLLWLPVTEHNFLNSSMYFWSSLRSGLVVYNLEGGGGGGPIRSCSYMSC
jgi:hypothetical protein